MNDRRCDKCEGRGSVWRMEPAPSPFKERVPCSQCKGSGWMPSPGDALPPLPKRPWGPDMTPKPKPMHMPGPDPHFHVNKLGILEACYHRCRTFTTLGFWLGLTLGFPIEHLLWEKAPLFSNVTHWLGL